jgi:cell division protein FtsL
VSDTTARQQSPSRAATMTAADPASTRPLRRPDPAVVHLRVVKPAGRSPAWDRRRVRLLGVVISAFVVAVVFGLVGLHVMLAQNQFRLDRLNTQAAAQQAQYEKARLQVDQLSAPARIVATAEAKLGMVPAAKVIPLMPSPLPANTTAAGTEAAKKQPTSAGAQGGHPTTDWTAVKPHLVPSP